MPVVASILHPHLAKCQIDPAYTPSGGPSAQRNGSFARKTGLGFPPTSAKRMRGARNAPDRKFAALQEAPVDSACGSARFPWPLPARLPWFQATSRRAHLIT